MQPQIECVIAALTVSVIGATFVFVFSVFEAWIKGAKSLISEDRKPAVDSDARLFVRIVAIGLIVGCVILFLFGIKDSGVAIIAGFISVFVGNAYMLYYVRNLNVFYLRRARDLFDQGDINGAIQDAQEVSRSSEALRPEAEAILRTIDMVHVQA